MDSYGMGPQRKIFPPRDVSYSGLIFPEQTILQYPELEAFGPEIGLTEVQICMIQAHIKAASVANKIAMEQCQARWASRFSSLHGILEQTVNGVKEDLAQWLDTAKALDLDEQRLIRTRPHFVKPLSTLVAAALAKASARATVPQRGAPSEPLGKKVKRDGKTRSKRGGRGGSKSAKWLGRRCIGGTLLQDHRDLHTRPVDTGKVKLPSVVGSVWDPQEKVLPKTQTFLHLPRHRAAEG